MPTPKLVISADPLSKGAKGSGTAIGGITDKGYRKVAHGVYIKEGEKSGKTGRMSAELSEALLYLIEGGSVPDIPSKLLIDLQHRQLIDGNGKPTKKGTEKGKAYEAKRDARHAKHAGHGLVAEVLAASRAELAHKRKVAQARHAEHHDTDKGKAAAAHKAGRIANTGIELQKIEAKINADPNLTAFQKRQKVQAAREYAAKQMAQHLKAKYAAPAADAAPLVVSEPKVTRFTVEPEQPTKAMEQAEDRKRYQEALERVRAAKDDPKIDAEAKERKRRLEERAARRKTAAEASVAWRQPVTEVLPTKDPVTRQGTAVREWARSVFAAAERGETILPEVATSLADMIASGVVTPTEDQRPWTEAIRRALNRGEPVPGFERMPDVEADKPHELIATEPKPDPEKAVYRYGMQNRPIGFATVPKGHTAIDPKHEHFRHGVVTYDKPLSKEEQESYELTPILDEAGEDAWVADQVKRLNRYREEYLEVASEDPVQWQRGLRQRYDSSGVHSENMDALLARLDAAFKADAPKKPAEPELVITPPPRAPEPPKVGEYNKRWPEKHPDGAELRKLPKGSTITWECPATGGGMDQMTLEYLPRGDFFLTGRAANGKHLSPNAMSAYEAARELQNGTGHKLHEAKLDDAPKKPEPVLVVPKDKPKAVAFTAQDVQDMIKQAPNPKAGAMFTVGGESLVLGRGRQGMVTVKRDGKPIYAGTPKGCAEFLTRYSEQASGKPAQPTKPEQVQKPSKPGWERMPEATADERKAKMDGIVIAARKRMEAASEPARGLNPTEADWMNERERAELHRLQLATRPSSAQEARERADAKREERRKAREEQPELVVTESKPTGKRYGAKISQAALTVFQTEVAELVADPEGHGLEGDELKQYQALGEAYDAESGGLRFPDTVEKINTLFSAVVELANSQDAIAEDKARTGEERKAARAARDGLNTLAGKVLARYSTLKKEADDKKPKPEPAKGPRKPKPKPEQPQLVLTPDAPAKPKKPRKPRKGGGKGSRKEHKEVGEHVEGSRADKWVDVTASDLAAMTPAEAAKAVTKARLSAEIDIDTELDKGSTHSAVIWKHALHKAIAQKPKATKEHQEAYFEGLNFVMESLDNCETGEDVEAFIKEFRDLAHKGGTEAGRIPETELPENLRSAEPQSPLLREYAAHKWGGKPEEYTTGYTWGGFSSGGGKIYVFTRANPETFAKEAIPGFSKRDRYSQGKANRYENYARALGKTFNDFIFGIKQGYFMTESTPRARARAAAEKADKGDEGALEAFLEKKARGGPRKAAVRWSRAVPEQAVREGFKAEHTVPKADAEQFAKDFGLPNIQFGNWVSDADAEEHIKASHEAMFDLADILGVDQKHVGLNGRLAVSFGGRGGGKASAHYEPCSKIINITKISGGGALCHEWGHALDNIVNETHAGKGIMMTDNPDMVADPEISSAVARVMRAMTENPDPDAMRLALVKQANQAKEAYEDAKALMDREDPRRETMRRAAVKAVNKANSPKEWRKSFYLQSAVTLSGGSNGYWTRPTELFARAFESHIEDELHGKGMKNTYLVSGTQRPYYGTESIMEPYPHGAERDAINAAMGELLEVLRSKGALTKAFELLSGLQKANLGTDLDLSAWLSQYGEATPRQEPSHVSSGVVPRI